MITIKLKKAIKILLLLLAILVVSLQFGCGKSNKNVSINSLKKQELEGVFYLSNDKLKIVKLPMVIKGSNIQEKIDNAIALLYENHDKEHCISPIMKDVKIIDYNLDGDQLSLNINSEYRNIPTDLEVLCRAAIVKTLVQIDGITNVVFLVDGQPLVGADNKLIGAMNKNTFVENVGTDINAYTSNTFTLYFANKDNTGLVKTKKKVVYLSSIPKEKVIIEELMKGPSKRYQDIAFPTLPDGIKINSIIVQNSVCFLDLDTKSINSNSITNGKIIIYSIVDSLTQLDNINKVKISINANDTATLGGVSLDSQFERKFNIDQ